MRLAIKPLASGDQSSYRYDEQRGASTGPRIVYGGQMTLRNPFRK